MTIAKNNQLHIIIDSSNPQEQKDDILKALARSVQWFTTVEDRPDTDDKHLNVIGRLIEQLAPSE